MSQLETTTSFGEKIRWWLAIGLAIAGLAANLYYEGELAPVVRVLIFLGGVVLGALVAASTVKGKNFFSFVKSSNIERQKIVWPTRNETLQTTLIVLVMVIIFGICLAIIDFTYSKLVGYFFG